MHRGLLAFTGRGQRFKEQSGVETRRGGAEDGAEEQEGEKVEKKVETEQERRRQKKDTDSEERLKEQMQTPATTAKQWQRGRAASLRDQELADG